MTVENINEATATLEFQELECATNGTQVPVSTYTKCLAICLFENDLCHAKYLWKRIPDPVKGSSKELQNVWVVGQKMWLRDFPGVYKALSEAWSSEIVEIMDALKEKTRQRAANLVSTAYSSINLETLAEYTGLTADETREQSLAAGWRIDEESKIVLPCKPMPAASLVVSCEGQLSKLTDFVTFLEN